MEDGLVLSARVKTGSGVQSIRGTHSMVIGISVTLQTHCTDPPNVVVSLVPEVRFVIFNLSSTRVRRVSCYCFACFLVKNVHLSFTYETSHTTTKILSDINIKKYNFFFFISYITFLFIYFKHIIFKFSVYYKVFLVIQEINHNTP